MKRATTKLVGTIACSAVVTGCGQDALQPTDPSGVTAESALQTAAVNERLQALAVAAVVARSHRADKVAENALDGNLKTRWQAWGDGQWIRADLGAARSITEVKIAWYPGDDRVATFDVERSTNGRSWTPIFSGKSSGKSRGLESYDVRDGEGRYVRIVGHGTTASQENLIAEIEIWGRRSLGQERPTEKSPLPTSRGPLDIADVTASAHRADKVPENTLDEDLEKRWQAWGDGQWIRFDLGGPRSVAEVKIAWYLGDERVARFDVETSTEGRRWSPAFSGESSGRTAALESYDILDTESRYIRIVGHGTNVSPENMIAHVEILGDESGGVTPPPSPGKEPPPSPSPSANTFFSDDFERYPVAARPQGHIENGFIWTAGSRGIEVSDDHAVSGSKSLRFSYPGEPLLLQRSSREKRFVIAPEGTTSIDEVWIEFMMRVPDNWAHRQSISSDNNKLLALWAENYHRSLVEALVVFEWGRSSETASTLNIASGAGDDPRSIRQLQGLEGTRGVIFDVSMRGRWIRLRFHVKVSEQGIIRAWRDNELIADLPVPYNTAVRGGLNYIRSGYLMGWSNSGFTKDTNFYIDDFKIWTADPNWTFQ